MKRQNFDKPLTWENMTDQERSDYENADMGTDENGRRWRPGEGPQFSSLGWKMEDDGQDNQSRGEYNIPRTNRSGPEVFSKTIKDQSGPIARTQNYSNGPIKKVDKYESAPIARTNRSESGPIAKTNDSQDFLGALTDKYKQNPRSFKRTKK